MSERLREAKDRYVLDTAPADLAEAYKIVREKLTWQPAAWKLGGTSKSSRKALGCTVFGPLAPWEVGQSPLKLVIDPDLKVCGEVEILLRLAANADGAVESFDSWAWGMELPSSSISNLGDLSTTALAMDRCAAYFLVIGKSYPMEKSWLGGDIRLLQDGKATASGSLAELTANPEECAREFLQEAKKYAISPQAGTWIATGGLTSCVPMTAGKVEVIWENEPVCQFMVVR